MNSPYPMRRRLSRTGSLRTTSSLALMTWAPNRLDSAGYYAELGLNPNRPWLSDDIRQAFRAVVKVERHMSPIRLSRLLQARRVLLDPTLRRAYDDLLPDMVWMDGPRWLELRRGAGPLDVVGGGRKGEASAPDHTRERVGPMVHYWYRDEGDPQPTEVERWIGIFVSAWWEAGIVTEVMVGFTQGMARVERRPWGTVLMVPVGLPPDERIGMSLVREAVGSLHSSAKRSSLLDLGEARSGKERSA